MNIIERPDGQRLTALAYANPMHDEAGTLLGAVNVLVDITQRPQIRLPQRALWSHLHHAAGRRPTCYSACT
jgi:hypothetical protein